jgi:hypothetical protein
MKLHGKTDEVRMVCIGTDYTYVTTPEKLQLPGNMFRHFITFNPDIQTYKD